MAHDLESAVYHEAGHAVIAIGAGGAVSKLKMAIGTSGQWEGETVMSARHPVKVSLPLYVPSLTGCDDPKGYTTSYDTDPIVAQTAVSLAGVLAQVVHDVRRSGGKSPCLSDGDSLMRFGGRLVETPGDQEDLVLDIEIDGAIVPKSFPHDWYSDRDRMYVTKGLGCTPPPHDDRCAFLIAAIWHQLETGDTWERVNCVAKVIIERQKGNEFEVIGAVIHEAYKG